MNREKLILEQAVLSAVFAMVCAAEFLLLDYMSYSAALDNCLKYVIM